MATALKHETETSVNAVDRSLRLHSRTRRQPKRLEPEPLRFPIPVVEILQKPWRRSPWLGARGVYDASDSRAADFNPLTFPATEGEIGNEHVWVAVDSNGHEIAIARWGNWMETQDEPTRQKIDRELAVMKEMLAILDEYDPKAPGPTPLPDYEGEDEVPTKHYESAAPEIRAMLERGELLHPGVHPAPFLSPYGRPVMLTVDEQWRLVSAIEVLPSRVVVNALRPHPNWPKDHPAREHPFKLWLDATADRFATMKPGLQLAPWIDYEGPGIVLVLGLDRHSRMVTIQETRDLYPKRSLEDARAIVIKALEEDDPVRIEPADDPMFEKYQDVFDEVDDDMLHRPRCLDCKGRLSDEDLTAKVKRCDSCTNKMAARQNDAPSEVE